MKTVKLDLYGQGRRQQVFDDNGDGVVRIKVYEISQDSPAEPMEYKEVGRYDQGSVTLHNQEALWVVRNGIKGECPNQATCDKCFGMRAQERGEPEEINGSDSDSALIATITVIVILVVIIAILVVIIVVLRRRRRPNTNGLPHLSTLDVHHSRSNAGGKQRVPVTHSLPAMHRRCSLDDLDNNGDYDYIVGKVPDEGPTSKRIATDPALRPRAPDPASSDRSAFSDRFPSGASKSSAADASSSGVVFSLPVESLPQPEDYEPPMPAHLPAPLPQAAQREFNPYLSPCKP
nr:hypothetical protein BaRGS_006400 [Batillaria attramentaria]